MVDTVKKTMIENYTLHFGHGDMAKINLECWKGGGAFSAITSYGNYGYMWNSIGQRHFKEFLSGLNFDYAMGKLTSDGGNMMMADTERTQKEIRKDIIEKRKSEEIDKDSARTYWDETDGISGINSSIELGNYFGHCNFSNDLYDGWPGEFVFEKPSYQVEGFWREVWGRMLPIWKKEIEAMKKELVPA